MILCAFNHFPVPGSTFLFALVEEEPCFTLHMPPQTTNTPWWVWCQLKMKINTIFIINTLIVVEVWQVMMLQIQIDTVKVLIIFRFMFLFWYSCFK